MSRYVVVQCIVRDNIMVQQYVTENYSRVWRLATPITSLDDTANSDGVIEVVNDGNNNNNNNNKQQQQGEQKKTKKTKKSLIKRYELFKDLIIEHGTDTMGATVTLAQLLNSSEVIIQRLVNNELMLRFKQLGIFFIRKEER
jgi:hypothetical protein